MAQLFFWHQFFGSCSGVGEDEPCLWLLEVWHGDRLQIRKGGHEMRRWYEKLISTWSLWMTTVWAFPPMLQWTSSVTRTRILSALRGRWKDEKAKWRKNKRKGLTLWQWRAPRRVHRLDPLRRGRRGRPQGRSCSACAAQPGCNVNFIQQNFYALLLFFSIFLPLKTHRV